MNFVTLFISLTATIKTAVFACLSKATFSVSKGNIKDTAP